MSLIVQKYGGTSLGSPEKIKKTARQIAERSKNGEQIVVVVSAMGNQTDELCALARKVSPIPPRREMDMLLSSGERVSMALMSMALSEEDVEAVSLTGSQSGIITSEHHSRAYVKKVLGDRIRNGIKNGKVVIVAGFQGVSEKKEITTLGRGGSDTTAIALAATLNADRCEIRTDVEGVYSADPGRVSRAVLWDRLPSHLALAMMERGARVLHPRAIALVCKYGLPIHIGFSLDDEKKTKGTYILGRDQFKEGELEEFRFVGVTSDSSKYFLTIRLSRSTVVGSVWDRLSEGGLDALVPVLEERSIRCFVDKRDRDAWSEKLEILKREGFIDFVEWDDQLVPVSVVGDYLHRSFGIIAKVTSVLAKKEIYPTFSVLSENSLILSVAKNRVEESVFEIHSHFILD